MTHDDFYHTDPNALIASVQLEYLYKYGKYLPTIIAAEDVISRQATYMSNIQLRLRMAESENKSLSREEQRALIADYEARFFEARHKWHKVGRYETRIEAYRAALEYSHIESLRKSQTTKRRTKRDVH